MWVEILPLHFCLQLMLFIWQQVQLDKWIRGPRKVLSGQILALENFDSQRRVLEIVSNAELNPAKLLTHRTLVFVFL